MVWIILGALGVPLWLCAAAIITLVWRNRALNRRDGDIACRLKPAGKDRWVRGHGLWVRRVFAFRGSPAMWAESLLPVASATTRPPTGAAEAKKLRRLGEHPSIVVLTIDGGATVEVAAPAERADDLLGPFADDPTVADAPDRLSRP